MKAVILAGGLGTRMREETEFKPKPMVEIDGQPLLWHLLKNLAQGPFNEFVICAGYRGDVIRDYFLNYYGRTRDFTVDVATGKIEYHSTVEREDWKVTVAETGARTETGGRVRNVRHLIDDERFLVTYGDGLADVDLEALVEFHCSHGRLATVTSVQPISRFGVLDISSEGTVKQFREKPRLDGYVSIGFFVFEPDALAFFDGDVPLETGAAARLAEAGEMRVFEHDGFWQPMDTYREFKILDDLWRSGTAPWRTW